jgi:heme/copper-type cytochrome/quinol oxidase subunit 2
MYAFTLLAAVFIIRRSLKNESIGHKINLKMFWINAIAFILSVFPIVFYTIYYYTWSREFYLKTSKYNLDQKHQLRKQALIWRGIVEGAVFLSQLVWVYVLQTFGADKEKSEKTSLVIEEI